MDFSMKTGDFYTVAIKMIQLTSQIRFIIKMYRLSASCEKKQLKQFDTTNAPPPKCSWCRTISDAFVGFLRRERQILTINLQCLQRGLNPFICNCTYWKSRSKPFTLTRIYSRCPINVSKDIHGKSALVYANRDQHNATQEHGYVTPMWPS